MGKLSRTKYILRNTPDRITVNRPPHNGDGSVLEKHWAGARGRVMKGALCLFAQDAESKLMLYTAADIQRSEADDQVLKVLSFWRRVHRGVKPTFVFDSRFTTYDRLSKLDRRGVRFVTLRRRGERLVNQANAITDWQRIHVPHAKRKYPNPRVHDSVIQLRGYDGDIRQVIVRGNGREQPTFYCSCKSDATVRLGGLASLCDSLSVVRSLPSAPAIMRNDGVVSSDDLTGVLLG